MARISKAAVLLLATAALAAAGCDKTVDLTFRNLTRRHVEVELNGPHRGDDDIGTIPAGGLLRYKMKIPKDELPATFEIEADPHETEFTVNEHTPDRMWVDITPSGIRGPRPRPLRPPGPPRR
jgi:hypothetical protein